MSIARQKATSNSTLIIRYPRRPKWYSVQLSTWGESQDLDVLKSKILKVLGPCTVFIPVYYEEDTEYKTKVYALEGYIFVSGVVSPSKLFEFKYDSYFDGPVMDSSGKLAEIEDSFIKQLKGVLVDSVKVPVKKGDTITVKDGIYKDLTGVVTKIYTKDLTVDVCVNLKSAVLEIQGLPMSTISVC